MTVILVINNSYIWAQCGVYEIYKPEGPIAAHKQSKGAWSILDYYPPKTA